MSDTINAPITIATTAIQAPIDISPAIEISGDLVPGGGPIEAPVSFAPVEIAGQLSSPQTVIEAPITMGQGPQGPTGEQGPPGNDGASSADQVSYNSAEYPTVEAALNALLYVAPQITAFSLSVGTVEIGSTVTEVTASWSYNKTMTTCSLTDFPGIVPADTGHVFSGLALTSNKSYTLQCGDGVGSDSEIRSITFVNRCCTGVSAKASGYASGDVMGLATRVLSDSKARSFTVNAGATEYIVYAYPARLGTVTFTVSGFEGGFEPPETVSVTNASGYTEDYYVYRSTNPNLGSTTVVAA